MALGGRGILHRGIPKVSKEREDLIDGGGKFARRN